MTIKYLLMGASAFILLAGCTHTAEKKEPAPAPPVSMEELPNSPPSMAPRVEPSMEEAPDSPPSMAPRVESETPPEMPAPITTMPSQPPAPDSPPSMAPE